MWSDSSNTYVFWLLKRLGNGSVKTIMINLTETGARELLAALSQFLDLLLQETLSSRAEQVRLYYSCLLQQFQLPVIDDTMDFELSKDAFLGFCYITDNWNSLSLLSVTTPCSDVYISSHKETIKVSCVTSVDDGLQTPFQKIANFPLVHAV